MVKLSVFMITVLIPLYNEEGSLKVLIEKIVKECRDVKYEILFIDDGSTDASLKVLQSIAQKNQHVRIYSFRKNMGKSEALSYGFQQAKGDYIVTLDADLHDKPEDIGKLIKKLDDAYDIACAPLVQPEDAILLKI